MRNLKEIKNDALSLDDKKRAELAKALLYSLEKEVKTNVDKAWKAEAKKRYEEIKAGEAETIPYEDVMAEVKEKVSQVNG